MDDDAKVTTPSDGRSPVRARLFFVRVAFPLSSGGALPFRRSRGIVGPALWWKKSGVAYAWADPDGRGPNRNEEAVPQEGRSGPGRPPCGSGVDRSDAFGRSIRPAQPGQPRPGHPARPGRVGDGLGPHRLLGPDSDRVGAPARDTDPGGARCSIGPAP